MLIILEQLGILFLFVMVGLIFGKKGIVNPQQAKGLSALAVNLFFPCTIFKAFYNNFKLDNLMKYNIVIVISAIILVVIAFFAHIISKFLAKESYEEKVYEYSLIVPNYAYVGYALAEGLFGAEGLLNMVICAMPVSVYIYTIGYGKLMKQVVSFKRLLNPAMITMVLGLIVGVIDISLPTVIEVFVTKASACMAPVAMILTGLTISEFNIKEMLLDKKVYIITAIRLIVIPLLVVLILKPFFSVEIVRCITLLYAMPCGLNTIIFAKLVDENYQIGAKLAIVSNVFSIITVPIFLNFV